MSNMTNNYQFSITESSIQTHLGILQDIIKRMAANSLSSKTWCIALVSAVLVIVAGKGKADFALIALIPTLLFFVLDAYYLALEIGFRNAHQSFVDKLHQGQLTINQLYIIIPEGNSTKLQIKAFKSFSVWGFYSVITSLIILSRVFILG